MAFSGYPSPLNLLQSEVLIVPYQSVEEFLFRRVVEGNVEQRVYLII